MKTLTTLILGSFIVFFSGCDKKIEEGVMESDLKKDVEMITEFGAIILRLSDETPKHRNNFIKLVNEGFYDSIAFHRAIDNFVIQAGNPTTKPNRIYNANGDPNLYDTLESEFRPNLFHKRGALGAAREPDMLNPSRASSGSQFYIVQNRKQTDSTIIVATERMNLVLAKNYVINSPAIKADIDKWIRLNIKLEQLIEEDYIEEDTLLLNVLKHKIASYNIDSLAKIELEQMKKYSYPSAHVQSYKTNGGTPHLDQNYTIFGEVIKGMNVVDSIAKVETGDMAKPINDVRIISAKMIKRKSY